MLMRGKKMGKINYKGKKYNRFLQKQIFFIGKDISPCIFMIIEKYRKLLKLNIHILLERETPPIWNKN